ncbi:MAG TPA: ion channel [Polyangiaceae bacterium]|jgi:inward rectifier potassium channel
MNEKPRGVRLPKQGQLFKVVIQGQDSRWFEDIYHRLLVAPWWQFFALLGLAFVVINTLFALAYLLEPAAVLGTRPGSFEDAFFFSVQTLATIGYGTMSPGSFYGHCVVTVEALAGMVSMALMTGLTFAKFARPTARVLFCERFVISRLNGIPHVMFRMANWRGNMIVEAQLHLVVLIEEHTAEGETFRRPIELPLVRDRNSTFILTWTAMHKVDEKSPFFGEDPLAQLRAMNAQIFLTLNGLDDTMGQNIHARYNYSLADCVPNHRFADVIHPREDGARVVDYTRFHELIPLATGEEVKG